MQVWNGIEINSIDFERTVEWKGRKDNETSLVEVANTLNLTDSDFADSLFEARARRQAQVHSGQIKEASRVNLQKSFFSG